MRIKWTNSPGAVGWSLIILVLLGLHLFGCVLKQEDQVLVRETKLPDVKPPAGETKRTRAQQAALRALEQGRLAFEDGDYNKAAVLFESVRQEDQSEELHRKALFALACTRLITAKDPQSYREAIALWDQWTKASTIDPLQEDPRMLTSLLRQYPQSIESQQKEIQLLRHQIETLEEIHRRVDYAVWNYWRQSAQTDLLQEDPLKVMPRIEHIPHLLQRQQDEIQRLRHQIEALEEIDRTIEEKKKVVAPD